MDVPTPWRRDMSLSDELAWISANELARRIRARQLSPVEVVDAFIARIEARNPSITALVHTAFDEARTRARAAEDALMSGAELGPLHGVPTAYKDLFGSKLGWRATFGGIRALKDFTAPDTSLFPARIEAAGGAPGGGRQRPPTR